MTDILPVGQRAATAGRSDPAATLPPVDPDRWPDVAALPASSARTGIARVLFERVVARLAVRVRYPGGRVRGAGGPHDPELRLVRPGPFYRRLGAGGLIGFGESYMAGDWEADDLAGVLTVFARQLATLVPPPLQRLRTLALERGPERFRGTRAKARANIAHHYDLSNELFAAFLDPSLTYSSALFPVDDRDEPLPDDLQAAQARKIERLLDLTAVGPGSRLLEIGTGWGELAVRAARRGARVLSVTLSTRQQELARRRIAAEGMADRVAVEICDYREVEGRFDSVLSVEMIEAVGYDFLPAYFSRLAELVEPHGRIGLQAITMPHDRMLASRDTWTWIQKYIFPGGLCPSVTAIRANAARHGLEVTDTLRFGHHYARTLAMWQDRFAAAAERVERLGFDEVFHRMWRLYLAYSEAGFRADYLDVNQFLLVPAGRS